MAFKLTYRDGEADDYDDSTAWTVEDGVLKMGREEGEWTVLVSPSHWATIEVGSSHDDDDDDDDDDGDGKKKTAKNERSEKDDDDKDDEKDDDKDDDKDS
jgi:hypothetical protein